MPDESFDAVVIGAGPAGLSCALDLHESRVNYVVLERGKSVGGQLPQIENTIRDFAGGFYSSGCDLQKEMETLCRKVELNIRFSASVESIDAKASRIKCSGSQYQSKGIVIATGCRVRQLAVPGMGRVTKDVFYRIEGVEQKLEHNVVAIVGGGDSALTDALVLAEKTACIYLIHRNNHFKARADVVRSVLAHKAITVMLNSEVAEVIGEGGNLQQISVVSKEDGRRQILEAQRLVIRAGAAPNSELVKGQVRMDEGGHIFIDQNCATSSSGVYACGDVATPGYQRIATAIGQGSIAALAIRQKLSERQSK